MSTGWLFEDAVEKPKAQGLNKKKDTRDNASETDSYFRRGSRFFYHKSDEEYPAEYYWQLYPGLVVEVVMHNPYSSVAPGHVEPVLTRVHSINNFGVPGRITLGVGGFSNFDDLAKPIRCFPQRMNWGVVGDPARVQLGSGKVIYGTLMDVDNIGVHASDHPMVRVSESEPNKPTKRHKVHVGQLANHSEWLQRLSDSRVLEQVGGQYPRGWASPDLEPPPVDTDLDLVRVRARALAQRVQILKLKSRLTPKPANRAGELTP